MTERLKQLINVPQQQKDWIQRIVTLSAEIGMDPPTTQTEIIRVLIDRAMHAETPEAFARQLGKARLKVRLDDIGRRRAALDQEEADIAATLNQAGPRHDARQGAAPVKAGG